MATERSKTALSNEEEDRKQVPLALLIVLSPVIMAYVFLRVGVDFINYWGRTALQVLGFNVKNPQNAPFAHINLGSLITTAIFKRLSDWLNNEKNQAARVLVYSVGVALGLGLALFGLHLALGGGLVALAGGEIIGILGVIIWASAVYQLLSSGDYKDAIDKRISTVEDAVSRFLRAVLPEFLLKLVGSSRTLNQSEAPTAKVSTAKVPTFNATNALEELEEKIFAVREFFVKPAGHDQAATRTTPATSEEDSDSDRSSDSESTVTEGFSS